MVHFINWISSSNFAYIAAEKSKNSRKYRNKVFAISPSWSIFIAIVLPILYQIKQICAAILYTVWKGNQPQSYQTKCIISSFSKKSVIYYILFTLNFKLNTVHFINWISSSNFAFIATEKSESSRKYRHKIFAISSSWPIFNAIVLPILYQI